MRRVLVFFTFIIGIIAAYPQREHSNIFEDHGGEESRIVPIIHGYHKDRPNHRVLQLKSFNESLTLYLEPTDGYLAGEKTRVFVAKTNPYDETDVRFVQMNNVIKPGAIFFHDKHYLAALSISHDENGKPLIHGTIGDTAIRPLPPKLRNKFSKRQKRGAENARSSCDNCSDYLDVYFTHDHVITKITQADSAKFDALSKGLDYKSMLKKNENVKENKVPDIIYPELLITVEKSLFDIFHQDIDGTVEYILSYWNGVDLRFRAILNPKIRLNIAAIVLATDKNTTPYVAKNIIDIKNYNGNRKLLLNGSGILEDGRAYLYNETYYNEVLNFLWMDKLMLEFDAAVTMTAYDLCMFPPECANADGEYTCADEFYRTEMYCSTVGSAFYTGACAYDPVDKRMEAFAILEDVGNFASMIPSAHEMGHLLGASHNVQNKFHCNPNDGYLMSYRLGVTSRVFQWSSCSVNSIKSFLKQEQRARCMFNEPYVGRKVPRILPGQIFSRDELCHRIRKTKSCREKILAENCVQLYCQSIRGVCEPVIDTIVPEGLSCGDDKYCINAKCLSGNETVVSLSIGN